MTARALRKREEKLLLALREVEEEIQTYELADLVARLAWKTGYRPSTVRTYLSKKLKGQLIHNDAYGKWRVTGALKCSEHSFANLMTQTLALEFESQASIDNEEQWNAQLHWLAEIGLTNGYRLDSENAERLLDLIE